MNEIKLFNGYFRFLPEVEVRNALLREIEYFNLPKPVLDLFWEGWNSRFWVYKGYDGKSIISDKYEPRLASFLHDYMSRTGRGGITSDIIFRWIEIQTGTSKLGANTKFTLVLIGSGFLTTRDFILNRRNKPTKGMINLRKYIKQ